MTVKEFIAALKKQPQDAEVVQQEAEMGFYSAADVYPAREFRDYDAWVSLEDAPRPKIVVVI